MSELVIFDKPGQIHAKAMAWNHHRADFLESLKHCHGSHTEDDVLVRVFTGEYQLWFTPGAAYVTYFVQYPQFKAVNAFISAGSMESLYAMAPELLKWCMQNGCKRIVGGGRAGWLREAGATSMGPLMFKDI